MLARQIGRIPAEAIKLLSIVNGSISSNFNDDDNLSRGLHLNTLNQPPPVLENTTALDKSGGSRYLLGSPLLLRPRSTVCLGFTARSFASGGIDYGTSNDTQNSRGVGSRSPREIVDQGDKIYDHGDSSGINEEAEAERKPEESEGDLDHLLTKWEAMMDGNDPESALAALVEELDTSHGLPEWSEILERGDEEEALERAQRRSREQSLQQEFAARRVRVVDRLGRAYATGKRKCSIARCWIEEGPGNIMVNGRSLYGYFPALQRRSDVLLPFIMTGTLGSFDVHANIRGGGLTGQAQALRHGISRALQLFDPSHRPALKAGGLLTRDSRIVERKKPGRPKARKSFQWVKR